MNAPPRRLSKRAMGFSRAILFLTGLLSLPLSTAQAKTDFVKDIEPILIEHCFDCHGDGMDKGDFALDEYTDIAEHLNDHELWLTVWENTRTHIMPPADKAPMMPEELERLKGWIEGEIFKLDPEAPDPGRVTIRRLNREEYENTIKDVLGYTFNAKQAFPADDTGYGFDTIGDVLSISPLLMEKYVQAAQHIVGELVHTSGTIIPTATLGGANFESEQKRKANMIPLEKPQTFVREQQCDHPGDYEFELQYRIKGGNAPTPNAARMLVRVNGREVANRELKYMPETPVKVPFKAPLEKGKNRFEIEVRDVRPAEKGEKKLAAEVQAFRFTGPLDGSHKVYPSQYQKIFVDGPPPGEPAPRREYARKLLHHWGDPLYRRPIDEPTMERLLALMEQTEKTGLTFEHGFSQALTAILASPSFLFRAEIQPEPDQPGHIVPVDEYALASRLSYFLWSSAPDRELLKLAGEKRLRKELHAQVDRMIQDGKAWRFVENFTGQWLQTRDLDLVNISPEKILGNDEKQADRYFNYQVREAMRQEVEHTFNHILREDRPVLELLTADYTFLNEYLAFTYGIEGVKGREMQKVALKPEHRRGGILSQGAFLTITSNPTRTSPVKRGLYVLENLLGTPAPPAPEEVPTVEEQRRQGKNRNLTMRELMEVHRKDALCASCHARMDPIGLALENYNAIGMWREEENDKPIEAGGKLITGEPFANAAELGKVLATSRSDDFYRCLAEKLLTYAIGRGVEYYDGPTIEGMVERIREKDGRMSALIHGIVDSAPFQLRRGDGDRLTAAGDNDAP